VGVEKRPAEVAGGGGGAAGGGGHRRGQRLARRAEGAGVCWRRRARAGEGEIREKQKGCGRRSEGELGLQMAFFPFSPFS